MTDIALEPVDTASPIEHTSDVSLSDRLTALRRRTRFVVTDRTLLTVGSILMPLGAILVLLGWYGAAHTTRLFEEGIDKIVKKLGEEAVETVIAAKNDSSERIVEETSDLLYHLIVTLVAKGVTLDEIQMELVKRHRTGLKQ